MQKQHGKNLKTLHLLACGLSGIAHHDSTLLPLTGDASARCYYRLKTKKTSYILCHYQQEEEEKQSLQRFITLTRVLRSEDLPVAEIVCCSEEEGVLILEDLGDRRLFEEVKQNPEKQYQLYLKAVDLLARFHTLDSPEITGLNPPFDTDFFLWELRLFTRYYLQGMLHKRERDVQVFLKEITEVLTQVQTVRPVFCHRDYHSKNLMYNGGKLFLIDYQDARTGPAEYDLISLLKDCYHTLPEEVEEKLLLHYAKKTETENIRHFREAYELLSFQRTLKAIGSFAFLAREKGKTAYLPFIPAALHNIRRTSEKTGISFSFLRSETVK